MSVFGAGKSQVLCGLALVLLALVRGVVARADDADAGDDGDAGVSAAPRAGDISGAHQRSLERPFEPLVVLPPATPDPQIAPIVDGASRARAHPVPAPSAERPALLIKTILGLLVLIALAYLGGHPRVLALERKLGISQVITAGFPFVVLGWAARTPSIGLFNDELLAELGPLLRVGLGCIGFVAGYRFSTQPRPNSALLRTAAFATAVPFAFVVVLSGLLLLWLSGDVSSAAASQPVFLRDALILGTAGAMTAPSSREVFHANDDERLLARVLRTEELAGIFGLAIVAAYFRPATGVSWQLPGTAWLLLTLGLGATMGLIAFLVLNRLRERPEFVLLTLGLIGFAAGTAGYLRLSPIVIAFLAGTSLALLPDAQRRRLHDALRRVERPIYLMSLTVIGALWQIADVRGWLLVPVFTAARLGGKRVGVELGPKFSGLSITPPQKRVLAVGPIGPLAIAIVVDAQLQYPTGSMSPIVAAVIVGGMLTEIVVQYATRRAAQEATPGNLDSGGTP